jgi:formate--tetrahydrofolate ligase
MSDIEIAQQAKMRPIIELAGEKFGIPAEHLDPYGHYKAKISLEYVNSLADKPDGKLILVKIPAAERIDISDDGVISGLF